MRQAKQNASFWLGLVCFEEHDYPVAIDYLRQAHARRDARTVPGPRGPATTWPAPTKRMGETDKAIALYESDTSAQSHGNKLRCRQLKEQADAKAQAAAAAVIKALIGRSHFLGRVPCLHSQACSRSVSMAPSQPISSFLPQPRAAVVGGIQVETQAAAALEFGHGLLTRRRAAIVGQ